VSRTSIVLGKTLGGATVAVINALIMLVIATALGVISPGLGFLASIVFMILTALCFVSIGLIIASQMKSMEGFQMIMSFIIMPIFFLSGALFPLQNTPAWMQAIAHADPLTYGVDGIRGAIIGTSLYPLWIDFTVLIGFSVALILFGAYLFRRSMS